MAIDPRYIVKRNGSDIPFSRVNFSRESGQLAPAWQIVLPQPVLIDDSDTWTIQRTIAGNTTTLVNSKTARGVSSQDGRQVYTRTISGEGAGVSTGGSGGSEDLLEYCLPKTLIFVNRTWLTKVNPRASIIDGEVKVGDENNSYRYLHHRLPGKEVEEGTFECFLGDWTHHSIANFLATLVGYKFIANTPDMPIIDTSTYEVGSTWFDAIKKNFTMWQPVMEVADDYIYVFDVLAGAAYIPGVQKYVLTHAAINGASLNDTFRDNTIDHVIVTGRTTSNNTVDFGGKIPFQIIEVDPVLHQAHKSYTYAEPLGKLDTAYKQMGVYEGEWNKGEDAFSCLGLDRRVHTDKYFRSTIDSGEKWKLLWHISETYASNGALLNRISTEYKYGSYDQVVGSSTEIEASIRYPGSAQEEWHTIGWEHKLANRFVSGTNIALTSELEEGKVLYEVDSEGNKNDPLPLKDILRQDYTRTMIDKDEDTSQDVLETTIRQRNEYVNRFDADTLIQVISEYDYLSGAGDTKTKTLKNPERDKSARSDKVPWVKHYYQGNGKLIGGYGPCYRPPHQIQHEDIQSEEIAQALADRVFARRGPIDLENPNLDVKKHEVTLQISAPLPSSSPATIVAIPTLSYKVDDVTVEIPGGDYVLRRYEESAEFGGDPHSRTSDYRFSLTLRGAF